MNKLTKKELEELLELKEATFDDGSVEEIEIPITQFLMDEGYSTCKYVNGKRIKQTLTHWNGLEIELVGNNSVYHDGGPLDFVVRFGDIYIKFEGCYSSWGDSEYAEDYYQVFPKKKVVEITEWMREN